MEKKPQVKVTIKPAKADREKTFADLGGHRAEENATPEQPITDAAGSKDTFAGSPFPTGVAADAQREAVEEQDQPDRPDVLPK